MKFHGLLLLSLSITTTHAWNLKIKGVYFPFPPRDLEDLGDIYHAIPEILQQSWPLKELLKPWSPKFPIFISDARHPWIKENYLRLNSHKDITTALCTLKSSDPSRKSLETHLRSRGITLPTPEDLFANLDIDNNRAGVDRWGWQNAVDRLKEMLDCPAALENLRSLHVDIYAYDSERSEKRFMPTTTFVSTDTIESAVTAVPVAEISGLFAQLFTSAPNLEKLTWQIPCQFTQFFERDFDRMGVRFESIRHLTLGPFSDYMVRFAPRLEDLESGRYWHCSTWEVSSFRGQDAGHWLVKAVLELPDGSRNNITRLDIKPREGLTKELVTDIITAMPNLAELSLEGNVDGGRRKWDLPFDYEPGMEEELKSYLALLSHLPNLRTLGLPGASSLGLGFDGGPWCGNAYFGPRGRAYGRSVARQGAETIELAAGFALQQMPYLEKLSVGGTTASTNATVADCKCTSEMGVITGDGAANVPEVKWPWTGRMEEWTMETWPEPEPGSKDYDMYM